MYVYVCTCVGTIIDQHGDGGDVKSKGPVMTSSGSMNPPITSTTPTFDTGTASSASTVKASLSQQRLEDLDRATAGDPFNSTQ